MNEILNIEHLEEIIKDLESKPKIIEFLWMYEFCGNYDYAYIDCYVYIQKGELFERKFIGNVDIIPNNISGYYEKLSDLVYSFGEFVQKKYNIEYYFPSKGKVDCDNISWDEANKLKI